MSNAPPSRLALAGLALVLLACGGGEPPSEAADAPSAADFDPRPFLDRGREIQRATFATLSGELQAAMERGGAVEALRYCNVAAYPLTDSLSAVHGVSIRRATLRPRNPDNRATPAEAAALESFAEALARGEEPGPVVQEVDASTVAYYAPIRIQGLCLQCHGSVGAEVSPGTGALLAELYPDDEAVGYAEGDLRGLWSLTFRR